MSNESQHRSTAVTHARSYLKEVFDNIGFQVLRNPKTINYPRSGQEFAFLQLTSHEWEANDQWVPVNSREEQEDIVELRGAYLPTFLINASKDQLRIVTGILPCLFDHNPREILMKDGWTAYTLEEHAKKLNKTDLELLRWQHFWRRLEIADGAKFEYSISGLISDEKSFENALQKYAEEQLSIAWPDPVYKPYPDSAFENYLKREALKHLEYETE